MNISIEQICITAGMLVTVYLIMKANRHRIRIYTETKSGKYITIGYTYWSLGDRGYRVKLRRKIFDKAVLQKLILEFKASPFKKNKKGKILIYTPRGILDIYYEDYIEVNLHFI